jgi:hypothetical protein
MDRNYKNDLISECSEKFWVLNSEIKHIPLFFSCDPIIAGMPINGRVIISEFCDNLIFTNKVYLIDFINGFALFPSSDDLVSLCSQIFLSLIFPT